MIQARKNKEDSFQKNKDAKEKMLGERLPANKKFPFYVADCLYIDKSDTFGNHIRTKQDLKTGTLVASEKHMVSTLIAEKIFERCEYCKNRNELNLIPCNTCTRALYCSEKCRQEALESYHNYICGIDRALSYELSCIMKLFCFGLNCFENATEFTEFLRETEGSDATGWDVDFKGMDQKEVNKNLFLVMNSFSENQSPLSLKDLNNQYKELAHGIAIVLNHSKLKDVLVTEEHKAAYRNFYKYYLPVHVLKSRDPFFETVCSGILSLTNFFNHSCAPNVRVLFDDSKAKFITVRPIKKGEQLFVSATSMFDKFPVQIRRDTLYRLGGFICKCEACEQPHKYPLENDLQIKDRGAYCHSSRAERDFEKLITERNVDTAIKQFRKASDYLDTHVGIYPSYETSYISFYLNKCIEIFCACDQIW
jgi:hypothetical protein